MSHKFWTTKETYEALVLLNKRQLEGGIMAEEGLEFNEEDEVREGGEEAEEKDAFKEAAESQKEKDPTTLATPTELAGGTASPAPGTPGFHDSGPADT